MTTFPDRLQLDATCSSFVEIGIFGRVRTLRRAERNEVSRDSRSVRMSSRAKMCCTRLTHWQRIPYYYVLPHTATYYYVLPRTTTYYHVLLRTTTYYYVLLRIATYYSVLLRIATYYYALLRARAYGPIPWARTIPATPLRSTTWHAS